MINESALCKVITSLDKNIINPNETGFQYCNGYMMAECNYIHNRVISKLISVGALRINKSWSPVVTHDLTEALKADSEIEATKTEYIRQIGSLLGYVFKINGNYYAYNKKFIDVFDGVTYKAAKVNEHSAILRIYNGEKLEGIVLNMRVKSKTEFLAEMQELEINCK